MSEFAATFFISDGESPAVLQKILGHQSINTTEIYVHLALGDLKQAYRVRSPGDKLKV